MKPMKAILSASVLALSLLCSVQGKAKCIKKVGSDDSFCGCHLQDVSNAVIANITLGDVGIRYD